MLGWWRRLRPWVRRSQMEREMDSEVRFHFDQIVREFEGKGLSSEEALRRARLEFGGLTQIKDDAREGWVAGRVARILCQFRMAARNLLKSPVFTAVAVLTLALGAGVNTLMFSLLDQMILRDLPVRDPERLVVFHGNFITPGMYRGSDRKISFSWPKYKDFREHCDVFSGVAARFSTPGSLDYNGEAEHVDIELVTGNYFDVLGVRPAIGRVFNSQDNRTSMGHPVVVLGYAYWQRRFAGDPSIVGREIHVNGMKMTVVGVSAAGFHSIDRGGDIQLRIPLAMKNLFTPGWQGYGERRWAWLQILARLKPGLSLRAAEAGANIFYHQVMEDEAKALPATFVHRQEFLNDHLDLRPAAGGMTDQIDSQRRFYTELLGISGIVLIIACMNLAGLLLARTQARQRELAIRLALGAGRFGVVRQLATESLLLASAGGVAGILVAWSMLRPTAQFLLGTGSAVIDTRLDWPVLLFALGVTTLTALVFAIVPAMQLRRLELAGVLKNESGASSSRSHVRLRKVMVTAQLAFCVWLLLAAGLFARSLSSIRSADLGIRKEHLITFQFDPFVAGYKADAASAAFSRLTDALGQLPGVTSVGCSDYGVITGGIDIEDIQIEGYTPPPPDTETHVRRLSISPGYFQSVGTRLLAGRDVTPADVRARPTVVLVNQEFANHFLHGQNPVGRHIVWTTGNGQSMEIVGVVANQRYDGPANDIYPFYYSPTRMYGGMSMYVRTSQSPDAMLSTVRRTVSTAVPGMPVDHLRTMENLFDATIDDRISIATLAAGFGLLATAMAAIGLYGVMAYSISRRTREIGIRMALGAARGTVMRMVLREVGLVIASGVAIGLPTGLVLARLVRSQLYQVSPLDAPAAALAVGVVAAIGALAGLFPARRATGIEPIRALRWE